ncbi:kinesin-like protein KIF21A isoform X2 [Zootermopsis nevadensis]|uniref:kinesin-like protein KIF21A isoform X2 n=1 Tax=Zootermopsis nevadensis TaxID=136037 RepID=UPI000B8E34A7|nr:kinesin-like protein KIF21A isoform X2 [Zootermopsis nevadensis]
MYVIHFSKPIGEQQSFFSDFKSYLLHNFLFYSFKQLCSKIRIRPQIARELIDMCRICTSVTPGKPQVTLGSDKAFTYDYVFDTNVQQEDVYTTCVEALVNGSLEGYNATVLAYGQTGSGKTYTMGTGFDVEVESEQIGIVPRAIRHLFHGIQNRANQAQEAGQPAPEFKIVAQFMELYNEDIIDLFDHSRGQYAGKGGIKIHEDASGGIYVMGVTMKPIMSAEDALQCLRMGALSRTTASTQMNSQSSRSHAIFTLHIKQQWMVKVENVDDGDCVVATDPSSEFETLSAKFHFVDLAGSERLKRTGATGERAKEGISINCGLLALGNVISALGDKSRKALHVPYRDSKLTRLLQDSLGGNSRTIMIACVSPSDCDFIETLNTLNYANRARNIKNRVTINQDKSSRTIVLLRQEIQQLQLELLEYKQGKRMLGEDGVETVNDMFHENTMLQTENNNLRTRVKAMQETIDVLSSKNTHLLAERAVGGWIQAGSDSDVTEMIEGYLKEIEELRAKLLESEAMCQQLRRASSCFPARVPLSPHVAMTGNFDIALGDTSSVGSLIAEAKKGLQKDMELLSRSSRGQQGEGDDGKKNGVEDDAEGESDNTDSEEKAGENEEDSDSDTDTEDKDEETARYGLELAELTSEINIKQKLIEELERSQKRIQFMRQHYEDKLQLLHERIRATQEERDTVLLSFTNQTNKPTEKERKVRDEYERKLSEMQKEMKRLQSAKKEHARLLRNQTQHENQVKALKNDLAEMKRAKVKLLNKMKEESAKHKDVEVRRNREIAQLRKESRKRENTIRSLEAEKRVKEAVLKRKHEEVTALRKMHRGPLSNKAVGRIGPRHASKRLGVSPKQVKHRWQQLENNIRKTATSKQIVASMERDMDRQLRYREELGRSLDQLMHRRDHALISRQDFSVIRDLEDQIERMKANIDYVQESIAESQANIMQIEESKENLDTLDVASLVQGLTEMDSRYLIEKLCNMAINQSFLAAQKELAVKEMEAKPNELKQENSTQQQLLEHLLNERADNDNIAVLSSDSSAKSSRSNSPTDTSNDNAQRMSVTIPHKIRRLTALPEELLYPIISLTTNQDRLTCTELLGTTAIREEMTDSNLMPPPLAGGIVRVPSAPGALNSNDNAQRMSVTIPHKIRRLTALPEELLYPIISLTTNQDRLTCTELLGTTAIREEMTDSNLMPPPLAGGIVRVPSAPGALNSNDNAQRMSVTIPHKIRRLTALPEELLYPIISLTTNQDRLTCTELLGTTAIREEMTDSNLMPPPLAGGIVRVPSAPGALKYVNL